MSFAPTLPRAPLNAKALGLLVAAVALGGGSTIATVATASHQALPSVATQARQAPSTTDAQDSSGDTTDSTTTTTSGANDANANAFGQQVVKQVQTCQASGPFNDHNQAHGIGQCVSSWVKQNNLGASHHTH